VNEDLLARLAAHRTIGSAPRPELEWLAAHGTLDRFQAGQYVVHKGEPVLGLYIVLKGHITHFTDQGGAWRKVIEWRDGDVTGRLPYSRMTVSPGNSLVEEATDALRIDPRDVVDLPTQCPQVTALLVHVMVDRARTFQSSDLQFEKLASLGKLAAGLAHELNNPASAAARSARLITDMLAESDNASRALGAAGLTPAEVTLGERIRGACLETRSVQVRTPLERSDREEALIEWLEDHDADTAFAAALAETDVTIELLDELVGTLSQEKLGATLRWVAAGCAVRGLARDIERAALRVHSLVSAVKGFTYMDQASVPEPVDVGKGLSDTLALLAAKARGKSASVTMELPRDLPRVRAIGGELNQVWVNLMDNAIDAVGQGGNVKVSALANGSRVVVKVTDDGPGIPADLKNRIFEPFFTTKPVGQGTGLGLDIVRRLVDRNAGLIEVDSQPGHTEFRVALPVAT